MTGRKGIPKLAGQRGRRSEEPFFIKKKAREGFVKKGGSRKRGKAYTQFMRRKRCELRF